MRESFTKSFVRLTGGHLLQIDVNNLFGNKAPSDTVVLREATVRESFTKSFVCLTDGCESLDGVGSLADQHKQQLWQ